MRVLVTGASGFIGSHVARHLMAHGHDVIATGRDRARLSLLAAAGCKIVPADLSNDNLQALLDARDAVVHCAARAAPWGARSLFWSDNVVATERLVEAAKRSGVQRFVFVSSPSIYFRPHDQLQLTEQFTPPARWLTAYAETKWAAECRVLAVPEIGPVALRPRAVFGPRDAVIVPRLLAVAKSGFFPLPGGGAAWTDVTYIDNVVDAIVLALAGGKEEVEGRAFNITNGESIRVKDLLERLFAALNVSTRFVTIPRGLALGLAGMSERLAQVRRSRVEPRLTRYGIGLLGYSQTLDIAAARQALRYSPRISIDEGIARYARWRASP